MLGKKHICCLSVVCLPHASFDVSTTVIRCCDIIPQRFILACITTFMPEIWLNYGDADAVLEIMAENLAQTINSGMANDTNRKDSSNTYDAPLNSSDGSDTADVNSRPFQPTAVPGTTLGGGRDAVDGTANAAAPATDPAASHVDGVPALMLDTSGISERLAALDFERPFDLVPLHDSQSVRQTISSIFTICEQRSVQFPGILADPDVLSSIRHGLPEGSVAGETAFRITDGVITPDAKKADSGRRVTQGADDNTLTAADSANDDNGGVDATAPIVDHTPSTNARNLVFLAETEFDGLFGYETVATRLLRRFGAGEMLAAYAKRDGNAPAPGRRTKSFDEALKFADRFDVRGIDIVSNANGIYDIFVGSPQSTAKESAASLESHSVMDAEPQKTLIVSTGKTSSNVTLADSFSSVWNCYGAIRGNGLCILVAACPRGLGSDALRMAVEGRLNSEHLQNPSEYVDGMEELLFLNDAKNRCQIALVSVLPELYSAKLGIVPIAGMKHAIEYMKTTQGARQKASVISDGSRILLR